MTMFYHKTLDYIDITAMYAFDRKNKLLKIYHSCCFKTCVIIADEQIPKKTKKKTQQKKTKTKVHPSPSKTNKTKQTEQIKTLTA